MRFVVTVRDGSPAGTQTEVLVDAQPTSSFAELLPHLLAAFDDGTHPSFAAGVHVWVDGHEVEQPGQQTLVTAGLRPGAIVELHAAHERPQQPPAGVAEVRVVNGPGSGRIHRLTLGHTVIGAGAPGMDLADEQVPADGLTVIATAGGQVHVEPGPGLSASLDGADLTARMPWPHGAYLVAGRTVLELSTEVPADEVASDPGELTIPVIRRPKPPITPPGGWPAEASPTTSVSDSEAEPEVVEEPGPRRATRQISWDDAQRRDLSGSDVNDDDEHPATAEARARRSTPQHRQPRSRFSWRPGGGGIGHGRGRGSDRGASRTTRMQPAAEPVVDPTIAETSSAANVVASPSERARARRTAAPDPARLLLTTIARDATLWHRFPGDDGFLRLRVGLGESDGLPGVPITADLASIGVLGIAGDSETTHALAAWLLAQCAVLHSPRQVRMVALTTSQYAARRRWEWLVRVPHSDPGAVASADNDPEPPIAALIGSDDETTSRRLAELAGLIADRRLAAATSSKAAHLPRVVVLLDGVRRLRGAPGLTELLTDGPEAGVYTICIDDDENRLPPGCREVITCTASSVSLESGDVMVRPDTVEPAYCDQLSRLLAPLRDASPAPAPEAGLGTQSGLLTLLGLDDAATRRSVIESAWRVSPSGRVVIGAAHDGPFAIDLRMDGPHLLVAGEPAARPDALLTVVLAALAATNRPDHLNAILISTRPGPELAAGEGFPHVTGLIDVSTRASEQDGVIDLTGTPLHGRRQRARQDPQEPVARLEQAVAGIGAELDRRDALLSQAGARDVDDYAERGHRLPRLLVIVDDLVELAELMPQALAQLVPAAQRGESLGLTLLMGTARPEDIAAHEIASVLSANATLRICLRVATEAASRAIIDRPEAARIPRRAQGRGFARTGHWPVLGFQAPRLGPAPSTLVTPGLSVIAGPGEPLAWALPWDDAGHVAPVRPPENASAAAGSTPALAVELADLATATQQAAAALLVNTPEPPWLPPLPRVVQAAGLRASARPGGADLSDPVGLPLPWALEERAQSQSRAVASIELGRSGHLLLSGASGSGRTTALRTIAGVLADRVSSADLHIYALDSGDGALHCLTELPHTGALVRRAERARAGRVLSQLVEEVAARHEQLADNHWADAEQQRAMSGSDDRLPYLLLMVDRWENLIAGADGDTLAEQVLLLLRRGAAAGLHVMVAGDRSLLKGRIANLTVPTVLLRPGPIDHQLAGLTPPRAAAGVVIPPGRGVWADSGVQLQVSVLSPDSSAKGQIAALEEIARRRARRNAGVPDSLRPVRL